MLNFEKVRDLEVSRYYEPTFQEFDLLHDEAKKTGEMWYYLISWAFNLGFMRGQNYEKNRRKAK